MSIGQAECFACGHALNQGVGMTGMGIRSVFISGCAVRGLAGAAALVALLLPLQAQQTKAPAAAAPKAAEVIVAPDTTVSRFGDWTMRCITSGEGKLCEMVQTLQLQVQGQNTPFANLAVGRPAKGEPYKFVAQLPNNITIATGIVVEAKPEKPLVGLIQRCLPQGCFADVVLPDDVRKRWQTRTEAGIVKFHDGTNKLVDLPLSFRGFGPAMEAMLKEAP